MYKQKKELQKSEIIKRHCVLLRECRLQYSLGHRRKQERKKIRKESNTLKKIVVNSVLL